MSCPPSTRSTHVPGRNPGISGLVLHVGDLAGPIFFANMQAPHEAPATRYLGTYYLLIGHTCTPGTTVNDWPINSWAVWCPSTDLF